MSDGVKLYLQKWAPAGEAAKKPPRGVVHIIHGMAEHSGRYARLAFLLCGRGFEVWAADQRGHGRTADPSVNNEGKGGKRGHCHDDDGFLRVTSDIDEINRCIRVERPGVPIFLLGHSWGSFIAQNYIETFGGMYPGVSDAVRLSGCVLSGTRGPGGIQAKMSAPFLKFLCAVTNRRRGSRFVRSMADGSYNTPFKPARTAKDWLSRDTAEVDAFINDPFCGALCSIGFYRDLAAGLNRIHRNRAFAAIRRDLPVYVFSGSADPVGGMGENVTELVARYRKAGIGDLEFVLYPDARHEPLNETNREEVAGNLLSWLEKHCNSAL